MVTPAKIFRLVTPPEPHLFLARSHALSYNEARRDRLEQARGRLPTQAGSGEESLKKPLTGNC